MKLRHVAYYLLFFLPFELWLGALFSRYGPGWSCSGPWDDAGNCLNWIGPFYGVHWAVLVALTITILMALIILVGEELREVP